MDAFPIPRADDLVLHMRLGKDYERRRWVLHPHFYHQVLALAAPFHNLYVCYDASEQVSPWIEEKALAPFRRLGAIVVVCRRPIDDFNFVRQFRYIAIAPSTFCWWAAFLSDAERVFFPDLRGSTTSPWRSTGTVRLEVSESRYQELPARTLWDQPNTRSTT
jgi:hypothetical protein